MDKFILHSNYKPTGDQPEAIGKTVDGLKKGYKYQTLLGVTGSGKTFTMARTLLLSVFTKEKLKFLI